MKSDNSNEIIELQLKDKIVDIEKYMGGDVLTYFGPIYNGIDSLIRIAVERIAGGHNHRKRPKIFFILETTGGQVEVTERIAETLRHHYKSVEFIVPNFAMSAGTVLALSGDAIHMNYFSVLGPIDPQVSSGGRHFVPAAGYLAKYKEMIEKSNKGELTSAELTLLVQRFDLAELYSYEQALELTVSLLKKWLVQYKFKNWKTTETKKKPVTKKMREDRAEKIAKTLQDTKYWFSHGRGINIQVLRRVLKLKIEDYGSDADLYGRIGSYNRLLNDYMGRLGHNVIVSSRFKYIGF